MGVGCMTLLKFWIFKKIRLPFVRISPVLGPNISNRDLFVRLGFWIDINFCNSKAIFKMEVSLLTIVWNMVESSDKQVFSSMLYFSGFVVWILKLKIPLLEVRTCSFESTIGISDWSNLLFIRFENVSKSRIWAVPFYNKFLFVKLESVFLRKIKKRNTGVNDQSLINRLFK